MKNIVLCFDRTRAHPGLRDASNAEALFRLLDNGAGQLTWYHSGTRTLALRWREAAIDDARAGIAGAYAFLIDSWEPGDRIFIFGVGRGAFCARELSRLLGTVGVLPAEWDDLVDYVLASYALPRTRRTPQDWQRVSRLAARLAGRREIAVPVQFLGLWDTVRVPGLPKLSTADPLSNVVAGRHAVAIDGGYGPFGEHLVAAGNERIEEVWFRGAHCDIAGGSGACWPLADIALDWVLDGAVRAGATVRAGHRDGAPAPPTSTRWPRARARFRSGRCRPTRWCTPASTCTCARIRSIGGGCPRRCCGRTWTGSPAASGRCAPPNRPRPQPNATLSSPPRRRPPQTEYRRKPRRATRAF